MDFLKIDYRIRYEDLVLVPLITLSQREAAKKEITIEEIRRYKIRISEVFSSMLKIIKIDADRESRERFVRDMAHIVNYNSSVNDDESSFTLSDDSSVDKLMVELYNSVPSEVLSVLSNEDILRESFYKNSKSYVLDS